MSPGIERPMIVISGRMAFLSAWINTILFSLHTKRNFCSSASNKSFPVASLSNSKNGFDVKYHHPNLVYISWLGKTNKSINHNTKQQSIVAPKKPLLEYKSINNYRPSGNFVYNNNSLNLFEKSSNKLFK